VLTIAIEGELDLERFLDCAVFGPRSSLSHQLRQFRLAAAIGVNDLGQVVGASGPCCSAVPQTAVRAVLWQTGQTIDLGNLGGTIFNLPVAINNHGQVVGFSGLAGNTTFHAFLWQNGTMSDLGTLPGDVSSSANNINDKGQVVGQSCDAKGNCRAFLWQNGSMTDLNLLVPPHSRLYLTNAGDINKDGWITGEGYDAKSGRTPAVLLVPSGSSYARVDENSVGKVILPESVRTQLSQHRSFADMLPAAGP
jgi:probable HAF family extracellular repeat protein